MLLLACVCAITVSLCPNPGEEEQSHVSQIAHNTAVLVLIYRHDSASLPSPARSNIQRTEPTQSAAAAVGRVTERDRRAGDLTELQ